jgi:mannitol/fructose-specific phosphotransferase system IIA component (Ntr-type)
LRAVNRWEAIYEFLGRLAETGAIKSENLNAISGAVRKREQSMSTGIGFGIGIPHASTDLISELVVALGRAKHGIAFDALDSQPVSLVVLFLVPQEEFQKHLHTVAGIAKLLQKADLRQSLEQATTAEAMLQIIQKQEAGGTFLTIHS